MPLFRRAKQPGKRWLHVTLAPIAMRGRKQLAMRGQAGARESMHGDALHDVAIVGTGLVGCGWAVAFALAGANVRLYDDNPEALASARPRVKTTLADMQAADLATGVEAAVERITAHDTLAAALDGADYVQENAFRAPSNVKSRRLPAEIGCTIGPTRWWRSSSSGHPGVELHGERAQSRPFPDRRTQSTRRTLSRWSSWFRTPWTPRRKSFRAPRSLTEIVARCQSGRSVSSTASFSTACRAHC